MNTACMGHVGPVLLPQQPGRVRCMRAFTMHAFAPAAIEVRCCVDSSEQFDRNISRSTLSR